MYLVRWYNIWRLLGAGWDNRFWTNEMARWIEFQRKMASRWNAWCWYVYHFKRWNNCWDLGKGLTTRTIINLFVRWNKFLVKLALRCDDIWSRVWSSILRSTVVKYWLGFNECSFRIGWITYAFSIKRIVHNCCGFLRIIIDWKFYKRYLGLSL